MAKERIKTIGMCVSKKDYDTINKFVSQVNQGKELDDQMSVSAFTKKIFMYGFKVLEHNNKSFSDTDKYIEKLFNIENDFDNETHQHSRLRN